MFIALVATSMVGAQAQKFQGGEKNLEVNFSPLSAKPIEINGIRFRMFNSESSAIRVGFGINGDKTTDVIKQPYFQTTTGTDSIAKSELYSTTKNFGFSIRPGYEMHFAGTDRLSPYVGVELIFSMDRSSYREEYHSGNTADTEAPAKAAEWSTWTIERKDGSRTFGLNAVAGADFYFADNFYLGVELGLGFQGTKQKDSEITVSDKNAFVLYDGEIFGGFEEMLSVAPNPTTGVDDMVTKTIVGNGSGDFKESKWGPNFQSTLRLGWLF